LDLHDRHPETHSYSEIAAKVTNKWGKLTVDISIWVMQLSVCCSYLYFIAEQLDYVLCDEVEYCGKKNMYILLLTIPALSISMIRTYTFLSYFIVVGLSVAFVGLISMMGYMSDVTAKGGGCVPTATDPHVCDFVTWNTNGIIGHIGFAMFVFEGNAAVTNVRAETKNTHKYHCILTSAITFMVCIYHIFATLAYWTYRG